MSSLYLLPITGKVKAAIACWRVATPTGSSLILFVPLAVVAAQSVSEGDVIANLSHIEDVGESCALVEAFAVEDFVRGHRVRQVAIYSTRTIVARVHTRPRDGFIHVHELLPVLETELENCHRPDVESMRSAAHQVIQDARDLGEAVVDGGQALDASRREQADSILTDIMMPRLDGLGLLQARPPNPAAQS